MSTTEPLRLGMVGGGPGAMIGPTHRIAAHMYGDWRLVAGAFSRRPERNRAMGEELGLNPGRVYADYREMARAESAREDGIEAVAVVTPNDSHVPISECFLRHGIHVICDKPLANSVADAEALRHAVRESGCVFALTHNYAGYPMVREARARVLSGELGAVRIVQAEYASGARSRLVEAEGDEKTAWRTDPAIGGPSAVLCDLGVHAHHLLRFVTGCEVEQVSASLATVVPGRTSHDDAQVSLRLSGGARGALWASYVAAGCRNGLRLVVCGETGTLEWWQEQPETLAIHALGGSTVRLHRGDAGLSPDARSATRRKPGQPEGFQEAFANVYSDVAAWIRTPAERRDGAPCRPPAWTTGWPGCDSSRRAWRRIGTGRGGWVRSGVAVQADGCARTRLPTRAMDPKCLSNVRTLAPARAAVAAIQTSLVGSGRPLIRRSVMISP